MKNYMKKIFLFLLLIVSLDSFAQTQFPNTYGVGYKRTGGDTLSWIPSDTLRVPIGLTTRTHIARKGTSLYYWNGSAWTSIGGGGGSGTVTSFSSGNLSPLFT